jgi:hypothetical protein
LVLTAASAFAQCSPAAPVNNASFASGTTFIVNVNGAGQNDKLVVGGTATLSGGTVQAIAGKRERKRGRSCAARKWPFDMSPFSGRHGKNCESKCEKC